MWAVAAHTDMMTRMMADPSYMGVMDGLISSDAGLARDMSEFSRAVASGDWGGFGEYVGENYDSSKDYFMPIAQEDFFGFLFENDASLKTVKVSADALGGDKSAREQLKAIGNELKSNLGDKFEHFKEGVREALDECREYLLDSGEQVLLGNYTDKVTPLGTGAQVFLGVIGVDTPFDARDLSADFVNWEWSWPHTLQTSLDMVGVIPLVGAVKPILKPGVMALKHADEAADVGKQLVKNADEVGEAVKGASESNYILFNKAHKGSIPKPKGTGPNGGRLQSHHGLQQQWAIDNLSKYGYDPSLAPTVTIETGKGMPHSVISNLQNSRREARVATGAGKWSSTLQEELSYIVSDFRAAGFSDETINRVLEQQYKMLDKLNVPYERIKY